MKRGMVLFGIILGCGPKAGPSTSSDVKEKDPAVIERHNKAIPYRNKAIDARREGDWFAARKALQECVEELNDPDCASELADLESQHRF